MSNDGVHRSSLKSLEADLVSDETPEPVTTKSRENSEIPEIEPLPSQIGTTMTIINLLNTLLGGGIIAAPNSIHSSGLIPGIILMLLIALLSHITTCMIFKLQLRFESDGYDSLVNIILGKLGAVIYSVFSLLFLVPGMLSYLIIGGDIITSWFDKANIDLRPLGYHALMILLYSIVLPIPITIPKGAIIISWLSTITVFCIIIYIAVMIYEAVIHFEHFSIKESSYSLARIDIDILTAISIYCACFNLPSVSLPIVFCYEENYQSRKKVSFWSMTLCFFAVLIPSVIGYVMFGAETNPNILLSFPADDVAMTVVRVAFFLIVNFSFPMVGRSVEATWGELIFHTNNAEKLFGWKRAVVLILTCAIPLIVAMFLPQAKIAMAIGSASGGFIVAFIFPAILWLKTTKKKLSHSVNVACMFLAIVGIIFAVAATYVSVVGAIKLFK